MISLGTTGHAVMKGRLSSMQRMSSTGTLGKETLAAAYNSTLFPAQCMQASTIQLVTGLSRCCTGSYRQTINIIIP